MAAFETVAAYTGFGLGILNAGVGVVNQLRSRREAVRTRQRALRGELREALREIAQVCTQYEDGNVEVLRTEPLGAAARKLQRIRDEGLLSPGDTHLMQLHDLLCEVEGRWHAATDLPATTADQRRQLLEANRDVLNEAVARVHARTRTYMTATTKMDNGPYLAYLRWMRMGLLRSQGA